MRIVFAGTSAFAVPALAALCQAGHQVELVLTQPDRKAGRGLEFTATPVAKTATELGLPIEQPMFLADIAFLARVRALAPEALVVAAYGKILPQPLLDIPRYGALNIHASLLPRWRGAAPIQRAILAGDPHTGVGIMQMEAGLDTGPILLEEALEITEEHTAGAVSAELSRIGARLIVAALRLKQEGRATLKPQAKGGISYAPKIAKAEAAIDWNTTASEISRKVRAFNPSPGATTTLRGVDLKIWKTSWAEGATGVPGMIIGIDEAGITVACADSALRIIELQRAGSKRLLAPVFARGNRIAVGERLGVFPTPN